MKWACDPRTEGCLADAGNAGMTEEELDAVMDIAAAVNASIVESLNQRIDQRKEG